jgi:hypothetical protein
MNIEPTISRELQDAIEDGGDEALRLVLWAAIDRKDDKMIAYITRTLNERRASMNGSAVTRREP